MSSPLHVWPSVPELARRRFCFSPAISGIAHNEWTLHHVNSDEAVVRNVASQEELSIPRRVIGNISRLEEPVRAVALLKRLEYHDGRVRPADRAVIPMPPASDAPRVRPALPATVVPISEEPPATPRWRYYLRISVALGCLACIVAVYVLRQGRAGRVRRPSTRPAPLVLHSPESAPLALQQKI
jgi:hypothetical protein